MLENYFYLFLIWDTTSDIFDQYSQDKFVLMVLNISFMEENDLQFP